MQPDAHTDDLLPFQKRMGEDNWQKRINRERRMLRQQSHHLLCPDTLIRTAVSLVGLHRRGVRNMLDIFTVQQAWHLPGLPEPFDGFRILQLSDIHINIHPDLPAVIQQLLRNVHYDACVLTGDFSVRRQVARGRDWKEPTAKVVAELTQPVYGILGNHDALAGAVFLESIGVRMLLNESTSLEREGLPLYLVGVDDPSTFATHDFDRATTAIPDEACAIALAHSPECWPEAQKAGIALLLSGHTHAGQICLPGGRALLRHVREQDLMGGRWQRGILQGYTSAGTGACAAPYRFNCPPEITLHTLRCG